MATFTTVSDSITHPSINIRHLFDRHCFFSDSTFFIFQQATKFNKIAQNKPKMSILGVVNGNRFPLSF